MALLLRMSLPDEDVRLPLVAEGAEARQAKQQRLRHLSLNCGKGRGSSKCSHDALWWVHRVVFACRKCGGLTDFLAAKRARRKVAKRVGHRARSDYFGASDGCYGRGCSSYHRPGAFAAKQAERRAGLRARGRVLIRPPVRLSDLTVVVVGRAEALRVAGPV